MLWKILSESKTKTYVDNQMSITSDGDCSDNSEHAFNCGGWSSQGYCDSGTYFEEAKVYLIYGNLLLLHAFTVGSCSSREHLKFLLEAESLTSHYTPGRNFLSQSQFIKSKQIWSECTSTTLRRSKRAIWCIYDTFDTELFKILVVSDQTRQVTQLFTANIIGYQRATS